MATPAPVTPWDGYAHFYYLLFSGICTHLTLDDVEAEVDTAAAAHETPMAGLGDEQLLHRLRECGTAVTQNASFHQLLGWLLDYRQAAAAAAAGGSHAAVQEASMRVDAVRARLVILLRMGRAVLSPHPVVSK